MKYLIQGLGIKFKQEGHYVDHDLEDHVLYDIGSSFEYCFKGEFSQLLFEIVRKLFQKNDLQGLKMVIVIFNKDMQKMQSICEVDIDEFRKQYWNDLLLEHVIDPVIVRNEFIDMLHEDCTEIIKTLENWQIQSTKLSFLSFMGKSATNCMIL